MNYVVSRSAVAMYEYVAKPLLFRFSPDKVHELMVASGHSLQKIRAVRYLARIFLSYESTMLEVKVLGISFKNPLGLSAGLDKDAKLVPMLEAIGFGFAECGSVTFGAYEGNPQPWYTRLPKSKSIIVNSGLRSEGARAVIERVRTYSHQLLADFPLNISIAKTNSVSTNTPAKGITDYISSFELWEKKGYARYYTINISCPNTFGGEPFTNPRDLDQLLGAVDKLRITKPIFVKFPIDKSWSDTRKLLLVCSKHNVQGITFGNLYKDRATVQLKDSFDPSIQGNFSGKPCWEKSNQLLAKTYAEFGDRFVLTGVGGVFTAEDAYTKIKLGATLVEFVTGLIFGGPAVVGQINRQLVELFKKDGFTHVSQAVGVDVKRKANQ